jgi:hypothetical protein
VEARRIVIRNSIRRIIGSTRRIGRAVAREFRRPSDGLHFDAFHPPTDPTHPSQLCRCDGGKPYAERESMFVGHLEGCAWVAMWCPDCQGTGYCSGCQGDGTKAGS